MREIYADGATRIKGSEDATLENVKGLFLFKRRP